MTQKHVSLKEKAKTTKQFCDELSPSCILDCPLEDKLPQVNCSICEKEIWVRLEDAETKIKEMEANLGEGAMLYDELMKHHLELKQKLEQLLKIFPDIRHQLNVFEKTDLDIWFLKLRELLK